MASSEVSQMNERQHGDGGSDSRHQAGQITSLT
jgi:hypothetical protein